MNETSACSRVTVRCGYGRPSGWGCAGSGCAVRGRCGVGRRRREWCRTAGDRPVENGRTGVRPAGTRHGLLQDATLIYQAAAANGERAQPANPGPVRCSGTATGSPTRTCPGSLPASASHRRRLHESTNGQFTQYRPGSSSPVLDPSRRFHGWSAATSNRSTPRPYSDEADRCSGNQGGAPSHGLGKWRHSPRPKYLLAQSGCRQDPRRL